ncbi:hypothetical protein DFH09DRAFT_1338629 [Mycena vulgaris]|nr:hypothetical protein DFH09DRAFT_1338629 [Mycena vulgaris]
MSKGRFTTSDLGRTTWNNIGSVKRLTERGAPSGPKPFEPVYCVQRSRDVHPQRLKLKDAAQRHGDSRAHAASSLEREESWEQAGRDKRLRPRVARQPRPRRKLRLRSPTASLFASHGARGRTVTTVAMSEGRPRGTRARACNARRAGASAAQSSKPPALPRAPAPRTLSGGGSFVLLRGMRSVYTRRLRRSELAPTVLEGGLRHGLRIDPSERERPPHAPRAGVISLSCIPPT